MKTEVHRRQSNVYVSEGQNEQATVPPPPPPVAQPGLVSKGFEPADMETK